MPPFILVGLNFVTKISTFIPCYIINILKKIHFERIDILALKTNNWQIIVKRGNKTALLF